MDSQKYYRVTVDGVGVYAVVDRDCPKDDPRRKNKPDGSWLPKKGVDYPGAVSYWTEFGYKKYRDSGLMNWHASVVKGGVEIVEIDRPEQVLYEDEYQIIMNPSKNE